MEASERKKALLKLIERSREKTQGFWSTLSEDERAEVGTIDEWAPKDILGHITFWNEKWAIRLEAAAENQTPESFDDYEHMNREIFEKNANRSWDELLLYEAQTFDHVIAAVDNLPADKMSDPQAFEWTRGRPLWQDVAFTLYYHTLDHISGILYKRGETEAAAELHEEIAEEMITLDDVEKWRGQTLYNLACFYALHNQEARALELLAQAFTLNSDLTEWSEQDNDLDALRSLPEFKALYVD
jgi:hypothetical protein